MEDKKQYILRYAEGTKRKKVKNKQKLNPPKLSMRSLFSEGTPYGMGEERERKKERNRYRYSNASIPLMRMVLDIYSSVIYGNRTFFLIFLIF